MKRCIMNIKYYIENNEINGECEADKIYETEEIISTIIKLKKLIEKETNEKEVKNKC